MAVGHLVLEVVAGLRHETISFVLSVMSLTGHLDKHEAHVFL